MWFVNRVRASRACCSLRINQILRFESVRARRQPAAAAACISAAPSQAAKILCMLFLLHRPLHALSSRFVIAIEWRGSCRLAHKRYTQCIIKCACSAPQILRPPRINSISRAKSEKSQRKWSRLENARVAVSAEKGVLRSNHSNKRDARSILAKVSLVGKIDNKVLDPWRRET